MQPLPEGHVSGELRLNVTQIQGICVLADVFPLQNKLHLGCKCWEEGTLAAPLRITKCPFELDGATRQRRAEDNACADEKCRRWRKEKGVGINPRSLISQPSHQCCGLYCCFAPLPSISCRFQASERIACVCPSLLSLISPGRCLPYLHVTCSIERKNN